MATTIWAMHAVNMLDDPKVRELHRLGGWGAVELWREIIGYNREFRRDGVILEQDLDAAFLGRRMLSQGEPLRKLRQWLGYIEKVGLIRKDEDGEMVISGWPGWRPPTTPAERQAEKRKRDKRVTGSSRPPRDTTSRESHAGTVTPERDKRVTATRDDVTDRVEQRREELYRTSPVRGPLTPKPAVAEAGAVRLQEECPPGDPLEALLTSIGAFTTSAFARTQKARQLRAWGYGFEEVGALWEHAKRSSSVPLRLFRWATQEPGKMKAAFAKVPPPAPASALPDLLAVIADRWRAPHVEALA